jgi:hypothetical protein
VLEAFADSIDTVEAQPAADGESTVTDDFAELLARRDELATFLLVDPWTDPAAWEQHGALLAAVDRLRVEVLAASRPGVEPWHPEPMGGRRRVAVREALERISRRRSERVTEAGPPPR